MSHLEATWWQPLSPKQPSGARAVVAADSGSSARVLGARRVHRDPAAVATGLVPGAQESSGSRSSPRDWRWRRTWSERTIHRQSDHAAVPRNRHRPRAGGVGGPHASALHVAGRQRAGADRPLPQGGRVLLAAGNDRHEHASAARDGVDAGALLRFRSRPRAWRTTSLARRCRPASAGSTASTGIRRRLRPDRQSERSGADAEPDHPARRGAGLRLPRHAAARRDCARCCLRCWPSS